MKPIPIRQSVHANKPFLGNNFSIRRLEDIVRFGQGLHKHDFFLILALKKGSGTHEIDFTRYNVHDHSVFILRPGQVHRLVLNPGSRGFLMEFAPAFYQPKQVINAARWKKATGKNYCDVETGRFKKLYILLENVMDEFTWERQGFQDAIQAYLDLFFIEFVRQSRHTDPQKVGHRIYAQDRFEELINLLETNIVIMKSVSDYAELMNLSSYQLNAIAKSSVGKTVSELINDQILLEAKRFLLASTAQVKEIPDMLGYEDVSYFIRFFKKHTGQSPEHFRRNFK